MILLKSAGETVSELIEVCSPCYVGYDGEWSDLGKQIMPQLENERLLLDSNDLPENWNFALGITGDRRRSLSSGANHPDSFFNPTSETAMTVFTLGRLEGWQQARLVNHPQPGMMPRDRTGSWSSPFFRRFGERWVSSEPRTSALGNFLADRLNLDPVLMTDPFLLFEVRTFNNAFNGGKTIRNPSFVVVSGEWSRFDALVILPAARTLVFVESKVGADGVHGAGGHSIPQPIRNLETAFFLTTLPESQYRGWNFKYLLVCPEFSAGTIVDFFSGEYKNALKTYHEYVLDRQTLRMSYERAKYWYEWSALRQNLSQHLAVVYWSDLMHVACEAGFAPQEYIQGLKAIDLHGGTIIDATSSRWTAAGCQDVLPNHGLP